MWLDNDADEQDTETDIDLGGSDDELKVPNPKLKSKIAELANLPALTYQQHQHYLKMILIIPDLLPQIP